MTGDEVLRRAYFTATLHYRQLAKHLYLALHQVRADMSAEAWGRTPWVDLMGSADEDFIDRSDDEDLLRLAGTRKFAEELRAVLQEKVAP